MRIKALVLLLCAALAALAQAPKPDFAELEKVALEELKQVNAPGAAVAITIGEKIVYAKGFGLANVETGQPMTPEMLCRIGSTTKMMTAAVLVGLAEEGKLKLAEPVGTYIQGLNPAIARLTAHQLLSHTSGLQDYAQMEGLHDDSALGNYVRSWIEGFLFTEPGRIYSYSNPGYHLAGYLIETAGGKRYADVMAERLFKPLGMKRTTLRPTMAMTWPLAQGHEGTPKGAPAILRPAADNASNWPAGSVFTNVEEFARFAIAFLHEGRIEGQQALCPDAIRQMTTPHAGVPGQRDQHYGYGMTLRRHRGVRLWEHGGARAGYGSLVRMAPDQHVAIIAMANRNGIGMRRTVDKATELLLPLEAPPPSRKRETAPLTEAEIATLTGVYRNREATMEILVRDGQALLKSGGREFPLSKLDADRLAFTPPGAPAPEEVVVVPGPDGKPAYLFRGGRALRKGP